MITPPGRRPLSPRVTRHFEFTRIQGQLIAIACHALIPVVARPLERPSGSFASPVAIIGVSG